MCALDDQSCTAFKCSPTEESAGLSFWAPPTPALAGGEDFLCGAR
jgi:hypothetical protein